MRHSKRFWTVPLLTLGAMGTLGTMVTMDVRAQTPSTGSGAAYPVKPMRMVVPFAPGGTGEFLSRSIAPRMGELLGQQFIVDFRGGAGTTLAAGLVATSPADGYTSLIQTYTTQAINDSLYAKLSYNTRKDFASIGLIGVIPLVLAAHPSLPVRSARELADLSRSRPGSLNFGTAGIGTSSHFAVELFKLVSKADLTHIPYKGAGPATIDVMAGFIPLVADAITSLKPHIDGGKVRGIAIGSAQRSEAAPQLATFAESGYPGFEASTWWGILVPSRTNAAIIARLNTELNKALEDSTVKKRLLSHGTTLKFGTPAEADDLMNSEREKWLKVVKATGARVD
jgi:tripartite-type tricarboxylate transporter receptor subunit TctC